VAPTKSSPFSGQPRQHVGQFPTYRGARNRLNTARIAICSTTTRRSPSSADAAADPRLHGRRLSQRQALVDKLEAGASPNLILLDVLMPT
jgi:hypothetical protein